MVAQLHNHSHFSLLDGISRIDAMFLRIKELGQTAIALTDHGTMSGAIEFYRAGNKHGVKPIVGLEAYMAAESMQRRDPVLDGMKNTTHLTLLATNEVGYKNLIKLSSLSNTEGYYFRPRIDFQTLSKYSDGIFVLSGCMGGKISQLILQNNVGEAEKVARAYREVFGDRFAIEVHESGLEEQILLNKGLFSIADRLKIRPVAACDSHYISEADRDASSLMIAIQTGSNWTNQATAQAMGVQSRDDTQRNQLLSSNGKFHIMSTDEMLRAFNGREDAVTNTDWVAEQCNLSLDFSRVLLPDFSIPDGETPISWLKKQVYRGLRTRYGTITQEYKDRIEYELAIIDATGYALYFLIVQDYVQFARTNGIMAVPRGSVAGSLCIYALGICDIDPIKYGIIFERFLNEERKGMPDIDMDFADNGRSSVVRYVTEKYGRDHVAHIGTFQTLGARAAIKDVARTIGLDFPTTNKFTSLFPDKPDSTLSDAYEQQSVQSAISSDKSGVLKNVFDLACAVEGLNKSFGTHAAGILISGVPLDEVVPIARSSRKDIKEDIDLHVTQYDNNNSTAIIESLGLSKFDFLGLANLSIIRDACSMIKSRHNIDLYGESGERLYLEEYIPIEYSSTSARKAYDLLASGFTTALFQTESAGMRQVLRSIRPTRIGDLPAVVALFRPGPMDYIPVFAKAKHNPETITYLHQDLVPILEETYGVVTYQDQVLEIARKIAGFSWGEVDVLRKGMGKKIQSVIDEQRQKFITKSVDNGYDQETVERIWEQIAPFAGYGFNKAHAYCYGYVSFITAFLKANYPVEYMTAVMMHDTDNPDKLATYIAECRRMGIDVLPPCINTSEATFSIDKYSDTVIHYGLSAVKGVGASIANTIVEQRNFIGQYDSIHTFMRESKANNSRSVLALIHAGALDCLGKRESVEEFFTKSKDSLTKKNRDQAELLKRQVNFFDELVGVEEVIQPLPVVEPWSREVRMSKEFDALGFYMTGHPLDKIRPFLERWATCDADTIPMNVGKEVIVGGIIKEVRQIVTKKDEYMAFVSLEDATGIVDVIAFPGIWSAFCGKLIVGDNVLIYGDVSDNGSRISVKASDVLSLNTNVSIPAKSLTIDDANVVSWSMYDTRVSDRLFSLWRLFESRDFMQDANCFIEVVSNDYPIVVGIDNIDSGLAKEVLCGGKEKASQTNMS